MNSCDISHDVIGTQILIRPWPCKNFVPILSGETLSPQQSQIPCILLTKFLCQVVYDGCVLSQSDDLLSIIDLQERTMTKWWHCKNISQASLRNPITDPLIKYCICPSLPCILARLLLSWDCLKQKQTWFPFLAELLYVLFRTVFWIISARKLTLKTKIHSCPLKPLAFTITTCVPWEWNPSTNGIANWKDLNIFSNWRVLKPNIFRGWLKNQPVNQSINQLNYQPTNQ